jgi:hypothetical protein
LTDLDKFQNICLWQGWNLHQSDDREGIYTSQMAGREFTPVPDGREGIYTSQILINVQAFLLRQVW